jgi:hypothetical protein
MRTVTTLFAAAGLLAGLCGQHAFAQAAQSKAVQLKDLPANVQKTVQETPKGGAIESIAKAAVQKKATGRIVATVETFSKPGRPELYEAAYKDAKGKCHEVLVDADGKEVKD